MISRLKGTLICRDYPVVEVETGGGVVYEVEVPQTVHERLPPVGYPVELRTHQVVREDSMALFGFLEPHERELFRRLLLASGVGPRLALAMLSTFSARRLARALAEKDVAALTLVSGVGRRTAERMAVELADKVKDLALIPEGAEAAPGQVQEAVAALMALGFSFTDADAAVRRVVREQPDLSSEELIRRALKGK